MTTNEKSHTTQTPKKKKKRSPPPKQPKGTWHDGDDNTSNAPWTKPNKGSFPVYTDRSYNKNSNK